MTDIAQRPLELTQAELDRALDRIDELEKELATWQAMGKALHDLGLRQIKLPQVHFDEDRMDVVGSNGNEGLHYQEK